MAMPTVNWMWRWALVLGCVALIGCERTEDDGDEAKASAAEAAAEVGTPEDEVASLEALVAEWVAAAENEDRVALKGLAKTLALPSPDAFYGERWPEHAEALATEYRRGSLGFFVTAVGGTLEGHDVVVERLEDPAMASATGEPALYAVKGTRPGHKGSVSAKYFAIVDGTWRYVGDLDAVAAEKVADSHEEGLSAEPPAPASDAEPAGERPVEAADDSADDRGPADTAPTADGGAADGEATEAEMVEYVAVATEMVAIASAEPDCAAQTEALETYWNADAERLDRLAVRVHTRIENGLNLDHRPTLAMSLMPLPEGLVQATRGCDEAAGYARRLFAPGR